MPSLSAFELVTIGEGSTAPAEIRAVLEFAKHAEQLGLRGLWFGEHHLGPGRAGASPTALVALAAARTDTLRVGASVAVQPHYRPLALVEAFATIEGAAQGRIDLGLGRGPDYTTIEVPARVDRAADSLAEASVPELRLGDFHALLGRLLQVSPSGPDGFEDAVRQVLRLLGDPVATIEGAELAASPGRGSGVRPWIFGFGSSRSARFAAAHGLPYAVNHHVGAGLPVEAVAEYRDAFASRDGSQPRVAVSVHAVVGAHRAEAQRLASSYPAWFAHIVRRGFSPSVPRPGAEALGLDQAQRRTHADTIALRFIGEAAEVADQALALAATVDADEVIVNTVVHDSADKLRSFELLADAWHTATGPHTTVRNSTDPLDQFAHSHHHH